ncbi:UNVERIFIED_CONTAM: hypothetical protein Slati_4250200, partial [Sesamum latifolium]
MISKTANSIGFLVTYSNIPLRSSRKRAHEPKLSHNPSGDVDAFNLLSAKTMMSLLLYCKSPMTYETRLLWQLFSCIGYASLSFHTAKLASLTLWIEVESIIEVHRPHRFSHQFGFCQDVQGSLKKEILTCSLRNLDGFGSLVLYWVAHLNSPRVPITLEGSIGLVNGISACDLPKVDAVLNGELQLVSRDYHPSIETPNKHLKVLLPAISEKSPLVEDILEKSKMNFEAPFWPYSLTEVTWEVYEKSISLAKNDLFTAKAKEKEHANEVKNLKAGILQVVNQQEMVATKKEKVSMLENTPYDAEIEVEALEKME